MYIDEIKALTEEKVKEMALETLEIKGHNVYLIDEDGAFGYSALVFRNGKHVHYANDYELHHHGKERSVLRQWYIDTMNRKLFDDADFDQPLADYDEFRRKEDYLRNYYPMRIDYLSIFCINPTKEEETTFKRKRRWFRYYDPISFCYVKDEEFVKRHMELYNQLLKRKEEVSDPYKYWVNAFETEMWNHEYAINGQADYDTLSAFGNVEWKSEWDTLDEYFDQLGFDDIKRKAYTDARKNYFAKVWN